MVTFVVGSKVLMDGCSRLEWKKKHVLLLLLFIIIFFLFFKMSVTGGGTTLTTQNINANAALNMNNWNITNLKDPINP